MARNPKLKVFRTAIGFHDAYVAAPSKKAALEAWGAKSNLFARGVAEIVTDAKLAEAALAQPGRIVKVLRGSPAEQLAALGAEGAAKAIGTKKSVSAGRTTKLPPRPSREALDRAETELAAIDTRQRGETAALEREEVALRKRQAALREAQDRERAGMEKKRDVARTNYDRAMATWRDA